MKASKEIVLSTGFFTLARNESLKVDFRARIGAVLVKRSKPVAVGKNWGHKTHPLVSKYNMLKRIHAEFDAIIGIDRSLVVGGTMYLYRETSDGELAMARPCEMCQAFLKHMGLRRVYYTTKDGYDVLKINDVPYQKLGELQKILSSESY